MHVPIRNILFGEVFRAERVAAGESSRNGKTQIAWSRGASATLDWSRSVPDERRSGATRNFEAIRIGQLLCIQFIQFCRVSPVWRLGWRLVAECREAITATSKTPARRRRDDNFDKPGLIAPG